MTQPTEELIIWANTDVNLPELAGPNKTKPIDDLINKGWDFTEKPTADEFNYILNNMGKWINWATTDIEAGTSLNTQNTLVRRDGSGNFSAGTITAALTGNSSTATTLQTTRTINGTSFNGSTNITTNSWGYSRNLAFTGFATGNGNVDGSGNVSIELSMGSGFTSSKTTNGYTYLPNGILLQWGYASSVTEDVVSTITLPITFPNTAFSLSVTPVSNSTSSGNTDFSAHGKILSTSQIALAITSTSGAYPGAAGVYWLIIGH